jgi:hypothetical protein
MIETHLHPFVRRTRREVPFHDNDAHDVFAATRLVDVERGHADRHTYISRRSGILELHYILNPSTNGNQRTVEQRVAGDKLNCG